jgi:hypothetical protein
VQITGLWLGRGDNLLSGTNTVHRKHYDDVFTAGARQEKEKKRKEREEDIGCKVNPRRMKYMRIGTDV